MTARITPKPAGEAPVASVKPTIKKETVRIEVPGGPRVVPQATVKIQPAPVAARPPEAASRAIVPAAVSSSPKTVDEEMTAGAEHDPIVTYACYGVLLFAVVNFTLELLTYLAK